MNRDCQCPTGNEAPAGGDCIHPTCPRDIPVVPTVNFHTPRGRAIDFNAPRVVFDESHLFVEGDLGRAYKILAEAVQRMRDGFKDLALSLDPGEEYDTRERALAARRNRNTGPARPTAQAARRPRKHR